MSRVNWQTVRLGAVAQQRKEFVTIDDGLEYVRCRVQLHAEGIVERDRLPGALIKTKQQQVCRAGEFLVAEIDAKHGGYGIVPEALDGAIVSSHYFLFEIDESQLDRRFLAYFAKTPAFLEQVTAKGTTNYAAIRPQQVLDYEILLPPLAEQRRIVAKIERLARKIEEARRARKSADSQVQRFMAAEINVTFRTLVQRIDPVPLRTIAEMRLGKMLSGNLAHDDAGIPYLRNANIQWDRLDLSSIHRMNISEYEKEAYNLQPGDILTCEGGDVGKSAIWNNEIPGCIFQKALHRIRVDQTRALPRLVLYHLRWGSGQGHFVELTTQTTIAHLTGVKLSLYPMFLPPLSEQHRIVACLDSLKAKIERLKANQAQTAAELDALLPAILDRAFKGEL